MQAGLGAAIGAALLSIPLAAPAQISPPQLEISPAIEEPTLALPIKVQLLRTLKGYVSLVDSLAFSPDGTKLLSGGGPNEPFLKIWSVDTGKELKSIRAQQTAVQAVAISPNGQVLATSGQDAALRLWDWPTLNNKIVYLENELTVLALAITPDSRFLVSGSLDGIRLWNLNIRRPFYKLIGYGDPIYALAIAPNGYILASGNVNGKVRFWNLREGTIVSEFQPHSKGISGLAFTPDGRKLVTASQDKTVKIWDLETGQLLHEMTGAVHSSGVRSMALSPDGQLVASASNDGIRIWSVASGRLLAKPAGPNPDWVESIAFSPNGQILATGKFNGEVDLWQVISLVPQPTPASEEPPTEETISPELEETTSPDFIWEQPADNPDEQ